MSKVYHLTYSNGVNRITNEPYVLGQNLLINTIQQNTTKEVISKQFNLESIQDKDWYSTLVELKTLPDPWGRDGYFNAWKPLLSKEVYDEMSDGDILYYTDSSVYYKEGFSENIDKFFEYVDTFGHICGSFGYDFVNLSFDCCSNFQVWKTIWPECDYMVLRKPTILNSWFALKKNEINTNFINDWVNYTFYKLDNKELVKYHHTVDQSIFNILVYKYGMSSFYNNTHHDHNKNQNNIHRQLNSETTNDINLLKKWFINPNNVIAR
jgi:hypothetical protein